MKSTRLFPVLFQKQINFINYFLNNMWLQFINFSYTFATLVYLTGYKLSSFMVQKSVNANQMSLQLQSKKSILILILNRIFTKYTFLPSSWFLAHELGLPDMKHVMKQRNVSEMIV